MKAITRAQYVRGARRALTAEKERYWQHVCAAAPASAAWWRAWEGVAKCNAALAELAKLAELDEPGGDAAREPELQP